MILNSDQLANAVYELKRRSEHAFFKYEPTSAPEHNQIAFHSSKARIRLLFGGNQSGKSHANAQEIAWWATNTHPFRQDIPKGNINIWVISAEYSTLRTGVYRHLKNTLPDWKIIKEGSTIPNSQELPSFIKVKRDEDSACVITFMSAKGDNRQKFQAAGIHLISIDEEVGEDVWEELFARTLATGGQFMISATLIESFDWIVKLESRAERGDPELSITRLNSEFNPFIDKPTLEYAKKYLWSPETQEYRIKGQSRRSTGLIFNNWKDSLHVCDPFSVPKHWPRWCALDPGIRTCAVLWIAVGPNERKYAYREIYAHNEPLWQIAIAIKQAEGWTLNKDLSNTLGHFVWEESKDTEKIYSRLIDDKRNSRLITGDAGVLDQLYDKYGISFTPANKNRFAGFERIRKWLDLLEDGKPEFQVFSNLENFRDERISYRIRPTNRKKDRNDTIDEPVKKKDHLMDAWRYIANDDPKHSVMEPLLDKGPMYGRKRREPENEWLGTCY